MAEEAMPFEKAECINQAQDEDDPYIPKQLSSLESEIKQEQSENTSFLSRVKSMFSK